LEWAAFRPFSSWAESPSGSENGQIHCERAFHRKTGIHFYGKRSCRAGKGLASGARRATARRVDKADGEP